MTNQKLNVIYPRKYFVGGEERVHWMHVGVAWLGDKGTDIRLWVSPPASEDGTVRLLLRTPDRSDQERQEAYERRAGHAPPGAQVQYRRAPEARQKAPESRYEVDPATAEQDPGDGSAMPF